MKVYCDTSFLVSYLNEDDVNHAAARARAGRLAGDDFVLCEVHTLELPAAVRSATHRKTGAIPTSITRRIINRFDRAVTGKIFLKQHLDMTESVAMARSLEWANAAENFCEFRQMLGQSVSATPLSICGTWPPRGHSPPGHSSPSTSARKKSPAAWA